MNDRKNRSCRDNAEKYVQYGRGHEGVRVTEVLSKWQTRKTLQTAKDWQDMSTVA